MKIIEDNIKDTKSARAQFAIRTGSYTFDVPYDGGSVMHYHDKAFGIKVGGVTQTTIEPLVCNNILFYISNTNHTVICSSFFKLAIRFPDKPSF